MSKRTVELELATPGLNARGQPVRVPLGVAAAPGTSDVAPPEPDLPGEHMLINLGPQHPATHGVLRLVVELDDDTLVRVTPHLGYLHSGVENLGAGVEIAEVGDHPNYGLAVELDHEPQ